MIVLSSNPSTIDTFQIAESKPRTLLSVFYFPNRFFPICFAFSPSNMFRFVLLCLGVATASAITFSQEHIDGLLELGAPKLAKFIQRANRYLPFLPFVPLFRCAHMRPCVYFKAPVPD